MVKTFKSTQSCEASKPPALSKNIFKPPKDLSVTESHRSRSIANMVDRFVQSISQINDSGSFDTSLEFKHIQSPLQQQQQDQRVRHRCVTELDRDNLMKFVQEFETRQTDSNNNNSPAKSTSKNSPFFCRKAKAIYENAFVGSRSSSPKLSTADSLSDKCSTSAQCVYGESMAAPALNLQRTQPERSSLRSAAKLLQLFSAKKKCKSSKLHGHNPSKHNSTASATSSVGSSRSSSATASPVLLRGRLGCSPLPASDPEDEQHDDGICSASSSSFTQSGSCSRHGSPDSSFELHPPLVPTFRVTPPQINKTSRNPAYDFARFLRGSFHAKRASITTLRRSTSDPDTYQHIDFTRHTTTVAAAPSVALKSATSAPQQRVLADTTNVKRSDAMRGRDSPTANAAPFRRGWVQSSFRTPRTDKFNQGPTNERQQSPLVHRSASMTASDNNVYIKSMGDFICELNQTNSQQQVDEPIGQIMPSKIASSSSCSKIGITGVGKVPQLKVDAAQLRDAVVGGPTGVVAWGTSFERLLEDPAGLHNFAEFLKKEFSAENIYFWTACERFRNLENMAERVAQAMTIFSKHLGNGATEPVNVDSQARNLTEDKLQNADRDIFAPAQKQIFNLMKFDSYQRFIRSDLYKSCLEAEEKHQPLPYSADDLDELLRTHFQQGASSKLKKSASNAEDRRRKSLLPWHRKTRSKSRDGGEGELGKPEPPSKLPQLSSSSLKIPSMHNSASDVHSSRSSLCSFDAFPAANGPSAVVEAACSLCRVILSDGATTIVQTRPGEAVGQLIERLLEKRGLSYKFYNVVDSETSKSIDLQRAAMTLAGKQVLIEQGVAFKLDLPDPKVISVKSKPKKQLHEVIRPILHKYNYTLEAVRVLRRDTQLPLDLSLPVTVADGQRLQIVLLRQPANTSSDDYQNSCNAKFAKPALQKLGVTFASAVKQSSNASTHGSNNVAAQQATLDEITNKVFNELLQGKVDSHAAAGDKQSAKANDLCSVKSDDCASDGSSIFDRMRRRDTNIPGFKLKSKKKSTSSQHSEESHAASNVPTATTQSHPGNVANAKKPIIAKLKAGVRLQVTERVAENQDELLEGLKRAQLARLEDQRGTEINFELPDFLKNKENLSAAASKLRKVRANLSPVSKTPVVLLTPTEETPPSPFPISGERPQPAPRLSIVNRNKAASVSPMKIDEENTPECQAQVNSSNSSFETDYAAAGARGPPPLPPKPKVLPIKPNNWGVTTTITSGAALTAAGTLATSTAAAVMHTISATMSPTSATSSTASITLPHADKIGSTDQATTGSAYLEEPSSSFV